jgi:ATP-dependent RNA helicase RhlE
MLKLPKRANVGASFHEKKAKNKKVNVRYDHKKAMQEKYVFKINRHIKYRD